MRRLVQVCIGTLGATLLLAAASAPAGAYGNSGGNVQLYQATASFNCNNSSFCGSNLGGFWAWAVFNEDGTVDGTFTGCSHVTKAGAPGLAGAQHFQVDGTWTIVNGFIFITSEVDTASGGSLGTGTQIVIPSEMEPIGPAAKAKLSTSDFFGFSPPPGVTFNATVTPMLAAR